MIFVLNIGNTNAQYGYYENGSITELDVCPTRELNTGLLPDNMPIAAATVVPDVKKKLPGNLFWVDSQHVGSVDLSLVDRSTVGSDRLANAVALTHVADLPAICVDCGTAITYEIVDKNKFFYGGAISPGRKLLRKALNSYTAQLPEVPIIDEVKTIIGKDTVGAILSGTDLGILYAVKGMLMGIKKELGVDDCDVIMTGGDAPYFLRNIPGTIDGGIDFTLKGIAFVYEEMNAIG